MKAANDCFSRERSIRSIPKLPCRCGNPSDHRWARRIAELTGPLGTGFTLQPVVVLIAGDAIDALLDEAHPELALVAAWAMQHRHGPRARTVVTRALELTENLPDPLRGAQRRAISNVINDRLRASLQEFFMRPDKLPDSDAARELLEAFDAFRQRRELLEAFDAFRQRLMAEGVAKGEAKGEAKAILTVLEARGLAPSAEQRTRVLACEDVAKLQEWLRRAANAATVEEALG